MSLPDDYPEVLERLKQQVLAARVVAHRTVNTELLRLYWTIGTVILDRQERQAWGTKVISRLAQDLQAAFPELRGLSRSNLE